MDVGDAFEARGQPAAHLVLADEAAAESVRTARRLEHAVVREGGHDRVDVVVVERGQHSAKPCSKSGDIAPPVARDRS
jgi:hypothetical protein